MDVFTIRIVYKSGHAEDFEVEKFSIKDGVFTWREHNPKGPKPLLLGADDVAAVWQLGHRIGRG